MTLNQVEVPQSETQTQAEGAFDDPEKGKDIMKVFRKDGKKEKEKKLENLSLPFLGLPIPEIW